MPEQTAAFELDHKHVEWPKLGRKADTALASKSASSTEVDPVIECQVRSEPSAGVDRDAKLDSRQRLPAALLHRSGSRNLEQRAGRYAGHRVGMGKNGFLSSDCSVHADSRHLSASKLAVTPHTGLISCPSLAIPAPQI